MLTVLLSYSTMMHKSCKNHSFLSWNLLFSLWPSMFLATKEILHFSCCCSVTQSCLTLCNPMDFPVLYHFPEFAQTHMHWVGDAIQPSHPLSPPYLTLLLPLIFPRIRVFSKESVLHIRWPKYWRFSFNISPSNEYLGLISFSIDWSDLLAVQGTLRVFSSTTIWKHRFFDAQPSLWSNSHSIHDYGIS